MNIMVMCTQYPGYGGAATNAYAIIKFLRENGHRVIGVFIEDSQRINIDPDGIGDIYQIFLFPFTSNLHSKIIHYQKQLCQIMKEPDVILCKNYIAPICAKILYPTTPNVYLVSGLCNAIELCQKIPATKLLESTSIIGSSAEESAFDNTDIIVLNSPLSMNIFLKSFPKYIPLMYPHPVDTSRHTLTTRFESTNRIYDILVVSSILTRPEKNNLFIAELLCRPQFDTFTKIIIGNNNQDFKKIPNSTVYPLLPHNKLMQIMQQCHVLVYPSKYDSNPNTVREAIANGCIPIISNNIGYWESYPDYCVCHSYEDFEWINKITFAVENYEKISHAYSDNISKIGGGHNILDMINIYLGEYLENVEYS